MVFVIGRNKLAPTLADAIHRARNVAAPINAKAHSYKTPCAFDGKCHDCKSSDRICRATVIHHKKPKSQLRGVVVLIDEDLGF